MGIRKAKEKKPMKDRVWLAGMAMQAMLSWKGEWEIHPREGKLTGIDEILLARASRRIADAVLGELDA